MRARNVRYGLRAGLALLTSLCLAGSAFAQPTPPPSLPTLSPAPVPNGPVPDPPGILTNQPPPPPLPTGTAVVTDQADYAPGATAHIRGQEFQAGEAVRLQVRHANADNDNDSSPAHQPWQVTADAQGGFQTTWIVPADEDELGATLQLTATGLTSGKTAQALFTDAPVAPTYQQLKSFGKLSSGGYPYGGLIRGADGALYGTAVQGGSLGYGVVFKLNTDGSGYTILKNLDYFTTGANPYGKLTQGTDGALYGTAHSGGTSGVGTVFKLNPDGTGFTVLRNFDNSASGGYLFGGVIQGADGALYGTTIQGGSSGYGTVFKLNTDGSGFSVLKNFDYSTTGAYLYSGLMQGTDGALYGTTVQGGSSGYGTVFKLNPDGSGFSVLKNFDYSTTGGYFQGGELIQGTDGAIYGTTVQGGSSGYGTVFKLNPDGTGFTVLQNFDYSTTGGYLYSGLMQGADGALYGTAYRGGNSGYGTVFKLNLDGSGFTVLKNFDYSTTGGYLQGGELLQGSDGTLYGTAFQGGSNGAGTVFKLNSDGTGFAVLKHLSNGPDISESGGYLYSGVIQGTDGALYGTTEAGGTYGHGTVFKLNADGTGHTVLKSFDYSTSGGYPFGNLIQGTDGALYGTTIQGGSSGYGTVFKLNTDGSAFAVLKNFDYSTTGGYLYSGLVQGTDGALYGTAVQGGSSGYGTVFKLNPDGTGFAVLKGDFDYSTTGAYLYSELMQGADGALYGTAYYGGSSGYGTVFKLNTDGSGFTVLKNFDYSTTGGYFQGGGLVQRADGTIYGTAYQGGSSGYGTVFQLNPDGTEFSVVLNFDNAANGGYPFGKLNQGTDGNLYGTTAQGGEANVGTVFRLVFADAKPANTPPVAQCNNVTVSAGANCSAEASIDDGSFDPDAGDTITVTQTPAGPYPLGDTVVTLTVTDSHGASSTCTSTVTVKDVTPPTITCPANMTVGCGLERLAAVSFPAPTAFDNCDANPTVTCTPASGSASFPVGVTTVVCTVTDASGNSAACSFTVTRAPLGFTGFLSPIGGEVAKSTGGSFADPLRAFKLGSTIPVKFQASCGGSPVATGIHTLQATKYSNSVDSDPPIDATPTEAATTGNQFRIADAATGEWHLNLNTKPLSVGTWKLTATLSDGTIHEVWITIKK